MSRSLDGTPVMSLPPISMAALVDVLEAGEHAQRGALARAGRTDQDDELAVLDVEVEESTASLSEPS